jgi:hypothetical protein
MKFILGFKTPDVTDVIKEGFADHCDEHEQHERQCSVCLEQKQEAKYQVESIKQQIGKFVEHDEYVSIEFDTGTGTATVLPVK